MAMTRGELFDAHLDLAALAVSGRDMLAPVDALTEGGEHPRGPWPPPAVTLDSLIDGGVRFMLGTIFTERGGEGPVGYPQEDDGSVAHRRGRAQLEAYLTWQDRGLVALDLLSSLRDDPGVGELRGGMGVAEPVPTDLARKVSAIAGPPPIHAGVLMENADPIREPGELGWWVARGVVAIGLAWSKPSRYAMGNACVEGLEPGLTDLGRALVSEMDALGVVHDQSHLSEASTRDLFACTDAPVIASHSNCRALLGGDENPFAQRHLSDDTIVEIDRRGGVIGLNLVRNFIRWPLARDERPSIDEAVAHVERVCSLVGHTHAVGIGSDMDGGISADDLPSGMGRPSDLWLLGEALSSRGWSDEEVAGFMGMNWLRFWRSVANARASRAGAARAG